MRVFVTSARVVVLLAAAITGSVIGISLRPSDHRQVALVQPSNPKASSPTPVPTPPQPLYPLSIPAQRQRTYPGSPVTIEAVPQLQAGFRLGTISYVSDGLKIYAAVMLPTTPPPQGGYPGIIFDHGYVLPSGYQTYDSFYVPFASAFAQQGFAVVMPDYRGNGPSWGVPEGAFYSPGYVADTLNLAASLKNYPLVNTSQLSLVGHSMGGHVALVAALVRPQLFKSVILAAGTVGTLSDMYNNFQAFSDFGDPVTLGIREKVIALLGPPTDANPIWKTIDPYTYLSSLTSPMLLAQDPNDDTVPYRFSQELSQAMAAAGHPVTLTQYDGGHSFDGDARTQFDAQATAFIRKNLSVSHT